MNRPRRLSERTPNVVLGALCLAGLATCGDSTVYVRVTVSDIPKNTARVLIRPSLDGVPYKEELFDIGAGETTLVAGFKLPAETRGQFRAEVEPRGADNTTVKACDVDYGGAATAAITEPRTAALDVKIAANAPATGLTESLYGIWGRARDDVWVVGAKGQIGHFNGCYWRSIPSGTTSTLRGIHGWIAPSRELWAVGGDGQGGKVAIVHSADGATFSAATVNITGQLNDIWGSAPDGVLWAVGGDTTNNGLIVKNTGGGLSAWSAHSDAALTETNGHTVYFSSIDGLDDKQIYAVGKATSADCTVVATHCNGSIAVSDGTSWRRPTFGDGVKLQNLSHVYAESQGEIWIAGEPGLLAEWDGTFGTSGSVAVDINTSPFLLTQGLIGFLPPKPRVLYFTLVNPGMPGSLRRFLPSTGIETSAAVTASGDPIDVQTTSLWGSGPDDIWVIGQNGLRFHYDGTAIKKYADPL